MLGYVTGAVRASLVTFGVFTQPRPEANPGERPVAAVPPQSYQRQPRLGATCLRIASMTWAL
jgi:hypothetical protein